jgi:hypothetical protein
LEEPETLSFGEKLLSAIKPEVIMIWKIIEKRQNKKYVVVIRLLAYYY